MYDNTGRKILYKRAPRSLASTPGDSYHLPLAPKFSVKKPHQKTVSLSLGTASILSSTLANPPRKKEPEAGAPVTFELKPDICIKSPEDSISDKYATIPKSDFEPEWPL